MKFSFQQQGLRSAPAGNSKTFISYLWRTAAAPCWRLLKPSSMVVCRVPSAFWMTVSRILSLSLNRSNTGVMLASDFFTRKSPRKCWWRFLPIVPVRLMYPIVSSGTGAKFGGSDMERFCRYIKCQSHLWLLLTSYLVPTIIYYKLFQHGSL